jgi:hypothetical protein
LGVWRGGVWVAENFKAQLIQISFFFFFFFVAKMALEAEFDDDELRVAGFPSAGPLLSVYFIYMHFFSFFFFSYPPVQP